MAQSSQSTVFLVSAKDANCNLVLFFSFIEPQNKRTPDLPEEEYVKEEIKENEEAVKKMLVEATREFEEIVVRRLDLTPIFSPSILLL